LAYSRQLRLGLPQSGDIPEVPLKSSESIHIFISARIEVLQLFSLVEYCRRSDIQKLFSFPDVWLEHLCLACAGGKLPIIYNVTTSILSRISGIFKGSRVLISPNRSRHFSVTWHTMIPAASYTAESGVIPYTHRRLCGCFTFPSNCSEADIKSD